MTASMYYRCKICGCICNLKYQMGYSKKHPIRYKCVCGISIRGVYEAGRGMSFENAEEVEEQLPSFVVYSSGEFFTVLPFAVKTFEETIGTVPPPFILATNILEYEKYVNEFRHILRYRDERHMYVRALNELYSAKNCEKVKELIHEKFDPNSNLFPLNNEADYVRAMTMINQFQFLNHDGVNRTPKTTSYLVAAFKSHTKECNDFLEFIKKNVPIETLKKQIHSICDLVYEKIDLLMPAVSVDFIKEDEDIDLDCFAITTTSFEDVKQLYVDLYELIGRLLILVIGLDNIIEHGDYNVLKEVSGINVSSLADVVKMRNKGNIIKLIDDSAPIESLICKSLNSEIRNSIGHFSYESNEIADSFGQKIEFVDPNNHEKAESCSLLKICYDIWQMYKTLGIFNEIIHHVEIQILATEGQVPSFISNQAIFERLLKPKFLKKVYPNDLCPCGSGVKYKKCCGKNE